MYFRIVYINHTSHTKMMKFHKIPKKGFPNGKKRLGFIGRTVFGFVSARCVQENTGTMWGASVVSVKENYSICNGATTAAAIPEGGSSSTNSDSTHLEVLNGGRRQQKKKNDSRIANSSPFSLHMFISTKAYK